MCSENSDSMAGLGDISEPWLRIRIIGGISLQIWIHEPPPQLECFVEELKPQCFCTVPKIILRCAQS